jgi:septum formation protein
VLGSTSAYRRELLSRLGLPFDVASPDVDEQPLPGESPFELARRLARAKAQAVAARCQGDALVIGSDQVADLEGRALGKPGAHPAAVAQLKAMRGRRVTFHTAVCVVRTASGRMAEAVDSVTVQVRQLSDTDIETYLLLERPYDCAGSAKCEGLGITLLERIDSSDPTTLVGLPLITTTRLMRELGLDVLEALGAQDRVQDRVQDRAQAGSHATTTGERHEP